MKKFVKDDQVVIHFACENEYCLCCGEMAQVSLCSIMCFGVPKCSGNQEMIYVGIEVEHPAFKACNILVDAYSDGEEAGGSINWQQVDDAHEMAKQALGSCDEDMEDALNDLEDALIDCEEKEI